MASQDDIRRGITKTIVESLQKRRRSSLAKAVGRQSQQWLSDQCRIEAEVFGDKRAPAQACRHEAWVFQ